MTWTVPTLHHHRQRENPTTSDVVAICACGKKTTADMLTDIRSLPAAIRQAAQLPEGLDFACDGCLETVFREGRVTHHEFYAALGASPEAHAAFKDYVRSYPYPHGSPAHAKRKADGLG